MTEHTLYETVWMPSWSSFMERKFVYARVGEEVFYAVATRDPIAGFFAVPVKSGDSGIVRYSPQKDDYAEAVAKVNQWLLTKQED